MKTMQASAVSLALVFAGLCALADNLVWTGAKSAVWDRPGEANWKDASGLARTFTRGDNATLSDADTAVTTINLGSEALHPANVVFDVANAMTLVYSGSGGFRNTSTSFVKKGAGTLTLQGANGTGWSKNTMTCGVDIVEGTLKMVGKTTIAYPLLGDIVQNPEYRISPGATFSVSEDYHLSHIEATNRNSDDTSRNPLGGRILLDGGTFVMDTPTGDQVMAAVRELELKDGASVRFVGWGKTSGGIFRVADRVTVSGTIPSTVVPKAGMETSQKWMLDFEHPTEFAIADVSGDAGVDFVFPCLFSRKEFAGFGCPWGALLKTGPGTMRLNGKDASGHCGDFRSDVEVREGTLLLGANDPARDVDSGSGEGGKSLLGDMTDEGRKIEVTQTGTLFVSERGLLDHTYLGADLKTPIVVRDGGTLKVSAAGTPNVFGPLVFEDGRLDCAGRAGTVGMIAANGTVKISSKTKTPTVWPSVANGHWYLLPNGATAFDVDDVTGDGAVDFDFGLWLTYPYGIKGVEATDCGFVKKGAGTMRLSANHEFWHLYFERRVDGHAQYDYLGFLGEARVNEGTLQIDGFYPSNVVAVAEGACLSGTGTVGRVTFSEGAGFAPQVGQAAPLKILGDFAVPQQGVVDLQVGEASADGRYRVDFAQVGGRIVSASGNPFAAWSFRINGKPLKGSARVTQVGNVLRCSVGQGLSIVVR